jgi:hypothetical protein
MIILLLVSTSPGIGQSGAFSAVKSSVVLERIVVDCGGAKPSVFGPPESSRRKP